MERPPLQAPILRVVREAALLLTMFVAVCAVHWRYVTQELTFLSWGDNILQYYAWMSRATSAWRAFEPPLWDFSTDYGTSFVGEMQTGAFYPGTILLAFITPGVDQFRLDLFLLFHHAIAWYGMAAFLRVHRVRLSAAVVGGAVFGLSGPVAFRASDQANIFVALVYLPLTLALFERAFRGGKPIGRCPELIACGVALALTCLGGHPQPFIHTSLLLLVYSIARGGGALLSTSSAQPPDPAALGGSVYPSVETSRRADARRATIFFFAAMSVGLAGAAIQLLPSMEYFADAYRWVGGERPISGLDTVPYRHFMEHTLDWEDLRTILSGARIQAEGGPPFVTVTGVILAAAGLGSNRRLAAFSVVLVGGALLVALGDSTPMGWLAYHTPALNKVREPVRILCLYQFGVATLAGLGLAALTRQAERANSSHGGPLVAMACLALIGWEASEFRTKDAYRTEYPRTVASYYRRDALVDRLIQSHEADLGLFRVAAAPRTILPPNLGHVHAVRTTMGYRSSFYRPYYDFYSWDFGNPSSEKDDWAAVKFVVTDARLPELEVLLESNGRYLYERPHPLPLFQWLDHRGSRRALEVSRVDWATNAIEIDYDLPEDAEVIFAQVAYPGWRVEIDGKRRHLGRHGGVLQMVRSEAGQHTLRFSYTPLWYSVGLALWVLVVAALAHSTIADVRSGRLRVVTTTAFRKTRTD